MHSLHHTKISPRSCTFHFKESKVLMQLQDHPSHTTFFQQHFVVRGQCGKCSFHIRDLLQFLFWGRGFKHGSKEFVSERNIEKTAPSVFHPNCVSAAAQPIPALSPFRKFSLCGLNIYTLAPYNTAVVAAAYNTHNVMGRNTVECAMVVEHSLSFPKHLSQTKNIAQGRVKRQAK